VVSGAVDCGPVRFVSFVGSRRLFVGRQTSEPLGQLPAARRLPSALLWNSILSSPVACKSQVRHGEYPARIVREHFVPAQSLTTGAHDATLHPVSADLSSTHCVTETSEGDSHLAKWTPLQVVFEVRKTGTANSFARPSC
jgi:hypothetical protein